VSGSVLVVYGTVEGQSCKIAQFISGRVASAGSVVSLADAAQRELPSPRGFSATMVVAPLHMGRYPNSIVGFAARHHDLLNRTPSGFVSVSLSAAGKLSSDREGLQRCLSNFEQMTGWHPQAVHHAAGAFRFSRYSPLRRWALKFIAWRRGQPTDTSRDYELTDWERLGEFVDGFLWLHAERHGEPRPLVHPRR
jgi:menaquinone-dependent protoporphyrinogen oxidase